MLYKFRSHSLPRCANEKNTVEPGSCCAGTKQQDHMITSTFALPSLFDLFQTDGPQC